MSVPSNPQATEIGKGQAEKFFHHRVSGRYVRDLDDVRQVMMLAAEIADGDARRASLVSLDELRAIARLAALASIVVGEACAMFGASDAGAPAAGMKEALRDLAAVARPFMGMPVQ
jgi:hypothetical protein